MNDSVIRRIESVLTSGYSVQNFVEFVQEVFDNVKLIAPDHFRKEFTNFSSHIAGSSHVGEYITPDGKKIIIFSVQLLNQGYVENARSTQRSYAKKLIEASGSDAALIAFYTDGDPKWRLSFVRLDYEMKIENGKLKTAENITPAKRYSYLVGEGEPCHTAIERFRRFITDNHFHPTLEEIEEAFSVEAVTNEFFTLYCEKFHQLREHLEASEDFRIESEQHNFTAAQFAKKLIGQIVFLYFLQKKGWLGVNAWPKTMTEKEYKNAFFSKGAKSRELIPLVYQQKQDGLFHLSAKGLEQLTDEDEAMLAPSVKGEPWGTGPHNFMRRLFDFAQKRNANFFNDYLEPLFYNALNVNRGDQGYDPVLHCRIPFLSGGLFEPIDGYEWEHNDFGIPNEIFSNGDARTGTGILDVFDRYNFTMCEDEPLEREVAIDPEMLGKVFENLLEVKDRKSKGAFYTPREIVHYMCQESLINYLTESLKVSEDAIRDFILYGDFMKDEDTVKDKRLGNAEMYISEELYKIDASGKVVVNRLMDMDQALANVRVADPAVGSGAFPLGMLNEIVRARQNISAYMAITMNPRDIRMMYQMDRSPHSLKYQTIKNCIFAADIEPSAVDIAQLRLWLALVIDDETNPNAQSLMDGHPNPLPLPNLESNILCGNSLMDEFEGIELINTGNLLGKSDQTAQLDFSSARFDAILNRLIEKQDELFRCENTEKKHQLKDEIASLRDMIIQEQLTSCSSETRQHYEETKHMASKPYILWQLDFARVFREKGGFDIIIGNPPYVQLSKEKDVPDSYKQYLKKRFNTSAGRLNLFIFMIHKGIEILRQGGCLSFIIPNTILSQDYYKDTRNLIINHNQLNTIVDYQDMPFANAVVENVTLILSKVKPSETDQVRVMKGTVHSIKFYKNIPVCKFRDNKNCVFSINSNEFIERMFADSVPLNSLCNVNQAIALKGDKSLSCKSDYQNGYYKLLDGRNINQYGIQWTGVYLDYDLSRIHSCKRKDIFECNEKLLFRRVSSSLIFTYDDSQFYALNTLVVVTRKESCPCDLRYLLALLNSKLMNYIYANKFKSTKKVFSEIQARSVGELPIRLSETPQLVTLAEKALQAKKEDFNADISGILHEIDNLVYNLYGISPEEVELIESNY